MASGGSARTHEPYGVLIEKQLPETAADGWHEACCKITRSMVFVTGN